MRIWFHVRMQGEVVGRAQEAVFHTGFLCPPLSVPLPFTHMGTQAHIHSRAFTHTHTTHTHTHTHTQLTVRMRLPSTTKPLLVEVNWRRRCHGRE